MKTWPSLARLSLCLGAALTMAAPVFSQSKDPASDASALVDTLLSSLGGFKETTGAELQSAVAEIGGVPFKRDVTLEYLAPAELGRYIRDLVDSEYPPKKADADLKLLTGLDLLAADTPLRDLRTRLLVDNVVGFYDERPDKRRLYAVSEDRRLTPMNQIVLAHELRHALQDQYMNLDGVLPADVSDFDDRRFALMSLLEGDATVVMEKYLASRLGLSGLGGGLPGGLNDIPTPDVPGTPAILQDQLVQPYLLGRTFVNALVEHGGVDGVRRAWLSPPKSSEQILHPAKFLSGEAPRAVALDWAPIGGRVVYDGVVGEAMIRSVLAGQSHAEDAAAGWGGDVVRVWSVGEKTALVWRSVWDTPEDLRTFADTLVARFKSRYTLSGIRSGFILFEGAGRRFAIARHSADAVFLSSDDPSVFEDGLRAFGALRQP
jgi:hypothetical protein